MARNTKVEADHNAPSITQILAKFVATHPSRGWSDAVDHEAHRTFMNWAGCAVGAAKHESAEILASARTQVTHLVTQHPVASLLGAFAIGFAVARIVRALGED